MKKTLMLALTVFAIIFTACGPAAEDRQMMHKRAKEFQDSIANVLKQSMDEAAAPGPMMQQVPVAAAPSATPAPAAAPVSQNPTPPVKGK